MKLIFLSHKFQNKTHFISTMVLHYFNLPLKVRGFGTWKWAISYCHHKFRDEIFITYDKNYMYCTCAIKLVASSTGRGSDTCIIEQ